MNNPLAAVWIDPPCISGLCCIRLKSFQRKSVINLISKPLKNVQNNLCVQNSSREINLAIWQQCYFAHCIFSFQERNYGKYSDYRLCYCCTERQRIYFS